MRFFGSAAPRRRLAVLSVCLLAITATACAAGNTAPAPAAPDHAAMSGMDHSAMGNALVPADVSIGAVHVSYLDAVANIGDLRSRIAQWQAGNTDGIGIATEKLDRLDVLLSSTNWPPSLAAAVAKIRRASGSMRPALTGKDLEAAMVAAKALGDASHDTTHDFYGIWLGQVKGHPLPPMATHAIYLDLTGNIADLRSRVQAWEKGDESSLGIAKEKVERIQALLPLAAATGTLAKPFGAVSQRLPLVTAALERKELAAATAALKPLGDASHDLTHDFYAWLNATAGANDPACVQAAYVDLVGNVADLKARIAASEQGDANSLDIAREKVQRVQIVLAHALWPPSMSAAIRKTAEGTLALAPALAAPSPVPGSAALKPISDSMHDVTHTYYDYLPQAQAIARGPASAKLPHQSVPPVASHPETESAGSHGHAAEVTGVDDRSKTLVLGGFGAINAFVIGTAALSRRWKPGRRAPRAPRETTPTGGPSR